MSEMKKCVCRCTKCKAHQSLFNGASWTPVFGHRIALSSGSLACVDGSSLLGAWACFTVFWVMSLNIVSGNFVVCVEVLNMFWVPFFNFLHIGVLGGDTCCRRLQEVRV